MTPLGCHVRLSWHPLGCHWCTVHWHPNLVSPQHPSFYSVGIIKSEHVFRFMQSSPEKLVYNFSNFLLIFSVMAKDTWLSFQLSTTSQSPSVSVEFLMLYAISSHLKNSSYNISQDVGKTHVLSNRAQLKYPFLTVGLHHLSLSKHRSYQLSKILLANRSKISPMLCGSMCMSFHLPIQNDIPVAS